MDFLDGLKSTKEEEIDAALEQFISLNEQSFTFPSLNDRSVQSEIWSILIDRVHKPDYWKSHSKCLKILKIMSRDKQYLDEIINPSIIEVLVASSDVNPNLPVDLSLQYEAILECQKCIFNLVFNHMKSRDMFAVLSFPGILLMRLSSDDFATAPHNVKLFDLKILFLLTALNSSCRPLVRYEMKGIDHLVKFLDSFLKKGSCELNDQTAQLCCEAFKIIFNLLLATDQPENAAEEQQHRLMEIIRQILCLKSTSLEKQEELKSHAINLLTSINSDCYDELTPECDAVDSEDCFSGHDMSSVLSLIEFMDKYLDKPAAVLKEGLMPTLSVLIEYSSNVRIIRKFLRCRILPPLRDVTHRPEEGNELRNKLCRLMTCTITQVEFLVAEFLFVLCKENVRRLIKYTGYGNAAGLLAHRGLMMNSPSNPTSGGYSSDSEDSETEEYKQLESEINPVTGSYEPPRPNPLENMTEEQKEYEAVKLVNMIDRLQKKGIIQPARIGEDGRPHAVEHILELQENSNEDSVEK